MTNGGFLLLVFGARFIGGAYLPDKRYHKNNVLKTSWKSNNNYAPVFNTDKDISRYLSVYGSEMMLWRCKNAIQPEWKWRPLPAVELYCETIGTLHSIKWYHNGKALDLESNRYSQLIMPHFSGGRFFSRWIDFKLLIYNATIADSGMYSFRAQSPTGRVEKQLIYLDISGKQRRHSRRHRKLRKKQQRRRMMRRKLKRVGGRKRKNKLIKKFSRIRWKKQKKKYKLNHTLKRKH